MPAETKSPVARERPSFPVIAALVLVSSVALSDIVISVAADNRAWEFEGLRLAAFWSLAGAFVASLLALVATGGIASVADLQVRQLVRRRRFLLMLALLVMLFNLAMRTDTPAYTRLPMIFTLVALGLVLSAAWVDMKVRKLASQENRSAAGEPPAPGRTI